MPNEQISYREYKKYQTRSEFIHLTQTKQIQVLDEVKMNKIKDNMKTYDKQIQILDEVEMDSKTDKKKTETQNENTNNYFLLKCLAGFSLAAVATAGIIAAAVFNSSTAAGAGLVIGGAAATMVTPFILAPLLLIAVGTLALMPFLFGCSGGSNYRSTYVSTSPMPYYSSGWYGPNYRGSTFFSTPIVTPGNYHGHVGSGPIHGHGNSGPVHSHPGSGNTHGHGGGFGGNMHSHR